MYPKQVWEEVYGEGIYETLGFFPKGKGRDLVLAAAFAYPITLSEAWL